MNTTNKTAVEEIANTILNNHITGSITLEGVIALVTQARQQGEREGGGEVYRKSKGNR